MRRRLIGFNIHAPASESSVISVAEPLTLTSADSGNTYSLDSATARLDLPLRATLTAGWTVNVQTTFTGRLAMVQGNNIGLLIVILGGDPYDGISMDSLDATATIDFDGAYFNVSVTSGTVNGYWD